MATGEVYIPGQEPCLCEIETLIKDGAENYYPNQSVAEHLQAVHLVNVIGPWAVGKTTIMRNAAARDPNFGMKLGLTSRPVRPGESPYSSRFLPHNREGLNAIYNKLTNGDLVQIKVHPTNGYIYGSEVEDYQKPYVMLDTMASAVENVHSLPFQGFTDIALAAPVDDWVKRIKLKSNGVSQEYITARLEEAHMNLSWSLEQGDNLSWVVNKNGESDSAALSVISIARNVLKPNPLNRKYGEQMLRALEKKFK